MNLIPSHSGLLAGFKPIFTHFHQVFDQLSVSSPRDGTCGTGRDDPDDGRGRRHDSSNSTGSGVAVSRNVLRSVPVASADAPNGRSPSTALRTRTARARGCIVRDRHRRSTRVVLGVVSPSVESPSIAGSADTTQRGAGLFSPRAGRTLGGSAVDRVRPIVHGVTDSLSHPGASTVGLKHRLRSPSSRRASRTRRAVKHL